MLAMVQPEYISVEEAADREGVSTMTIRRAIKAGFLKYRGVSGRRRLLDAHELHSGVVEWRKHRLRVQRIEE